jgi:hypothetical protein
MSSYSHWDLVADLQLNYYVANATKYLTRHRSKNGREDVQKALHYVDKYIELIKEERMPAPICPPVLVQLARDETVLKFFDANGIDDMLEHGFFLNLICATGMDSLEYARQALNKVLAGYEPVSDAWLVQPAPVEPPQAFTGVAKQEVPVSVAAVMEPQFKAEGYWGDLQVLWKCLGCGGYFKGRDGALPSAVHTCDGSEPTPGYVNQDR